MGRFVTRNAKIGLHRPADRGPRARRARPGSCGSARPTREPGRRSRPARAYDLLAAGFGAGFNGPIPIVVDVNGDPQAPQKIYEGVHGLDGVASASEPQFNDERRSRSSSSRPTPRRRTRRPSKLVDRLRDDVVPAATQGGTRSRTSAA